MVLDRVGRVCAVLAGSARDPSTIFFELYNEGIACTDDVSNQLVAWLDDASF